MVLAQKVGRERGFAVGFLLTVVTFGIYAIYWNYRAHNELYRQFELEKEQRDEGMVWYVLGLTLQPLLIAYMWIFASNVDYLRRRIGLPRQTTPGKFVAVAGSGVATFAIAIILVVAASLTLPEDATEEQVSAALAPYSGAAFALFLVGIALLGLAYRGLQRDINQVWDAYDARMGYLRMHPEMAHPAPHVHDVSAQLAPAAPSPIPPPLAEQVAALRVAFPRLRALPELDDLLAQAEAGDASAGEKAETLLADVRSLLHEREGLLLIEEEPSASERLDVLEAALFVEGPDGREA